MEKTPIYASRFLRQRAVAEDTVDLKMIYYHCFGRFDTAIVMQYFMSFLDSPGHVQYVMDEETNNRHILIPNPVINSLPLSKEEMDKALLDLEVDGFLTYFYQEDTDYDPADDPNFDPDYDSVEKVDLFVWINDDYYNKRMKEIFDTRYNWVVGYVEDREEAEKRGNNHE